MTLSQFICDEKTPKEILDFCKDIKGLEAKHGSLAVAGVTDNKSPVHQKIPLDILVSVIVNQKVFPNQNQMVKGRSSVQFMGGTVILQRIASY